MKKMLFLTACMILCSCGNSSVSADAMKLQKTEGTAHVTDSHSQEQSIIEKMNLYDGYRVDTEKESYAWIDLDMVKLLEMDEESRIHLEKENKHLKVELDEGSLFFCVTEKLEEDESLEFTVPNQTNMSMSVRGTTGIIKSYVDTSVSIVLIEGEIEGKAGNETFTLQTGEAAEIYMYANGKTIIQIRELAWGGDVPDYAVDEITQNPAIKNKIEQNGGRTEYLKSDEKKQFLYRADGEWEMTGGDYGYNGFYVGNGFQFGYHKIDIANLSFTYDDSPDFDYRTIDPNTGREISFPVPVFRSEESVFVLNENSFLLNNMVYTLSENDTVLNIYNRRNGASAEFRRMR